MAALEEFGSEIWTANGPILKAGGGFEYPTRMVTIRLSNGGLFIWSPVLLTEELRNEVNSLGGVQHLIAPNTLHDTFLQEWATAYPSAKVHTAPRPSQLKGPPAPSKQLGRSPEPEWANEIEQVIIAGNFITTEVWFFHRRSSTLLITDLVQHFEPNWFSGWRSLVAKLDLLSAQQPEVPRKFRVAFYDRQHARKAVDEALRWPIERVIMAHAPPILANGTEFVRRAFRWLV